MRFEDLPDDWAQRPMTDPDLFEGVVDLVVTERSRAAGTVWLLLCHDDGRLLQPVCIEDFPSGEAGHRLRGTFTTLFRELAEHGVPALVVALGRTGRAELTGRDHELRQVLRDAAAAGALPLLGVAVAVPGEILTFPAVDDLADHLSA